ncbi:MAG: class I SAM-dependent RNA methyltransferase [Chitinophagaceae bacterium]
MHLFTTPGRIIITCNKRLSVYLEQEVTELGFVPVRLFLTGVELQGTINDCVRLNLNLRCASQILYSIKEFSADGPEDVYQALVQVPWETVFSPEGYFSVTSNVDHPSIRTSMYANVKVKDAVADRMRQKAGSRPDSGPRLDNTVIHLYWKDQLAEIFIDTSGETLAKHGYRKIPGRAPMLEALAAATLMATKWDRSSPFINPMCGSGTMAIEAVMLATGRRPGLFRHNYAFMHLSCYDDTMYQHEKMKLEENIVQTPVRVIATDNSEDAIHISRINAGIAGVEDYIEFATCDFENTVIPEQGQGVVYFNPEYGERLGVLAELEATYSRIGDFMKKRCRGYTGYIFTGNLDLAKKIGLKASRRIEFYTGKIDCRLLEYELYEGSRE